MCIIATIGIMLLLGYMSTFGGPGPLPAMTMVALILVIWIIAAIIMLVRSIVKKAIEYKDDYDGRSYVSKEESESNWLKLKSRNNHIKHFKV